MLCAARLALRARCTVHAEVVAVRRFSSGGRLSVFAIGNTIMDTVLSMPKIPIDNKVWIDSKKTYVGGQGANAAQAMAEFGLKVSFMTRVGEDMDGRFARDHFKELGMDTAHCTMIPDAFTMSACVTVETSTMRRSCLMHKDKKMFDFCTQAAIERAISALPEHDVLYTDGHQLDLVLPIARAAAQRGMPVISDMEVVDDESRELAALSTKLIAPIASVCEIAGKGDKRNAVLALASTRPGFTVVGTAGAEGSFGAQHGDKEATFVPAYATKAVDTTGSGDAYHAGYIVAIARGMTNMRDAMAFATRTAAAKTEVPGPVVSKEALRRWGLLEGDWAI